MAFEGDAESWNLVNNIGIQLPLPLLLFQNGGGN